MEKTAEKILSGFKKPAQDPEFYAAKAALKQGLPDAQMFEIVGKTCTIIDADGEVIKVKL